MGKINNVVKIIEFKDDMDLYNQIDMYMSTDRERHWRINKPYKVTSINLINEHKALVYLEEDLNVLQVHFFNSSNGEELLPEDEPHTEEFLTYQEVQLISELGSIKFDDTEYDVEDIKYEINSYGTRCINIYLN